MNFKEIFKAWVISFNPTEEQLKMAEERHNICNDCPSKSTILFDICTECGCPIGKKIFTSEFNACPLKKWEDVDSIYYPKQKTKKTML